MPNPTPNDPTALRQRLDEMVRSRRRKMPAAKMPSDFGVSTQELDAVRLTALDLLARVEEMEAECAERGRKLFDSGMRHVLTSKEHQQALAASQARVSHYLSQLDRIGAWLSEVSKDPQVLRVKEWIKDLLYQRPTGTALDAAIAKATAEAFEKSAQIVRYYLKYQDFPCRWEDKGEYEKGVDVACSNIERLLNEAASRAAGLREKEKP